MKSQAFFVLAAACPLLQPGVAFIRNSLPGPRHRRSNAVAFAPVSPVPLCPRIALTLTALSESKVQSAEADDISSIQQLFHKYCDKDGLMTRTALEAMPPFSGMLKDKDLMPEELDDIWNDAPKFPDVAGQETRIDVDSFVQIYRDVDDLFEDEDNVDADDATRSKADNGEDSKMDEGDMDTDDETVEAELERVYETICDEAGLISKEMLKKWDEIQKLLSEGLLGEDEFDEMWSKTKKSPGSSNLLLDVEGFLSFNVALDALFEFDDEEEDEDEEGPFEPSQRQVEASKTKKVVEGDDLPPGVLFSELADDDYLVGMEELKYWKELQDMLSEGDLLQSELEEIYDRVKKTESGKLDEDGFITLYEEVDALFEDDGEDTDESIPDTATSQKVKEDLVAFLDIIIEEDALRCGLECRDKDRRQVLNIVQVLEDQPTNMITAKNGNIALTDLAGTWELLYSSSSAMKFNNGLSGLGGSIPNGRFGGLRQTLKANKYLTDVEYKERIEVNPSSASFDVTVTGTWDIRSSVSLFTGRPSIIVEIAPDRVIYGPTSTRADHWKSLGPMNMLDLSYLDEDFRVMRGCTATDTLFIFKKVNAADN